MVEAKSLDVVRLFLFRYSANAVCTVATGAVDVFHSDFGTLATRSGALQLFTKTFTRSIHDHDLHHNHCYFDRASDIRIPDMGTFEDL